MVTGRKLLLADDSVTIQKVVDLTFTDDGLEVVTVSDGQQALEKLDEFTPDIVLADVFMPRLSGYQVCEYIKRTERLSHIPVMLLVGSFEPFDEAEARRVGADDFLTKPFQSIRTLMDKVRSLLSGGGSARAEAATQRLTQPSPEAEKENKPDTDFLERSTADTAPLPDVHGAEQYVGHGREVSFADLSMDDEMIETTPAVDYSSASQSRQTVQYSAADLKDAGIPEAVEPAPAATAAAAEEEPVEEKHEDEPVGAFAQATASEPVPASSVQAQPAAAKAARASNIASTEDALLDLGDIEPPSSRTVEADDFFLDLLEESPQPRQSASLPFAESPAPSWPEAPPARAAEEEAAQNFEETASPQAQEFVEGQVVGAEEQTSYGEAEAQSFDEAPAPVTEEYQPGASQTFTPNLNTAPTERLPEGYQMTEAAGVASAEPATAEGAQAQQSAGQITLEQLAPEVIDEIARRVVSHLSKGVVEQIAWEVVPQLAEILIKQRLEEKQ